MKHAFVLAAAVAIVCCCACSSAKQIYLGKDGKDFDSSVVVVTRKDRLAYVGFFNYKTTAHTAGDMISKSRIASWGLFRSNKVQRFHKWSGDFVLSNGTDSTTVTYTSVIGQDYSDSSGLIAYENAFDFNKESTSGDLLSIKGKVHFQNDSAMFSFFNKDDIITPVLYGFIYYHSDILRFTVLNQALDKENKVINKKYGNGLFLHDHLVAALDFNHSSKILYLPKSLPAPYDKIIPAYIAVVIGNQRIVPRQPTFFSTFF